LRTYRDDRELAAISVLSVLCNLPEAREISVICPLEDLQLVYDHLCDVLPHPLSLGDEPRSHCAAAGLSVRRNHSTTSSARTTSTASSSSSSTSPPTSTSTLPALHIRVLAVGRHLDWYGRAAANWNSREQLIYDAFHADLYVRSPLVLYLESDVLLTRRVRSEHLLSPAGLPYVPYGSLAWLCQLLMRRKGMYGAHVCGMHTVTARDAGTLFGVFNEFDFERSIPFCYQRAMFPRLRARVELVHGGTQIPRASTGLQAVLNWFSRHHDPHCNWLRYVPPQLAGVAPDVLQRLLTATDVDALLDAGDAGGRLTSSCVIGPSKPHTLGTFAYYFCAQDDEHALYTPRNLEHERHPGYIGLQLDSRQVRDPVTGRLSEALQRFVRRAFVDREAEYTELDPTLVNRSSFQ
jgi:hypothetical protein